MTKKTETLTPLPNRTLFATVSYDTWTKLTTLAARLGIGRLDLYSQAVSWAIDQSSFVREMTNRKFDKKGKAKS